MSPEHHVLSMKARRAAIYTGGGALLVAWLAAANTYTPSDRPPREAIAAQTDRIDDLAVRVREEGERLHSRLTHAPAPAVNTRNLFSFAPVAAPRASERRASSPAPEPDAAPMPPPPLPLILMGIAENPSPTGPVRTAILGATGDEIYMVTVGQTIAARYSVTAFGADAIELKDLATGGFRRLALK
jgi:hypothetical protein